MAISDYFNQPISVYSISSRNVDGEITYGTATTGYARLETGRKFLTQFTSEEVDSIDAVAFIPASLTVSLEDVIADSTTSIRYKIVDIRDARNRTSIHHKELILQKTVQ